ARLHLAVPLPPNVPQRARPPGKGTVRDPGLRQWREFSDDPRRCAAKGKAVLPPRPPVHGRRGPIGAALAGREAQEWVALAAPFRAGPGGYQRSGSTTGPAGRWGGDAGIAHNDLSPAAAGTAPAETPAREKKAHARRRLPPSP